MTPDEEARLEQISETLFAIASLDFTRRATLSDDGSALDGVAGAVNMLSEEIQAYIAEREKAQRLLTKQEEQLRQAQKLEAVGKLAGGVAHDFNNLLAVILSYTELLLDDVDPGAASRADLEEIFKAARRGADLTKQLLLFSRQELVAPQVLQPNTVLAEMDKLLRSLAGERVKLVLRLAPGLRRIKTDRSHLEQIIVNLAVNARDAMPNGGQLTISTDNAELDEGSLGADLFSRPGPHVVISVVDTGVGIDAATKARVFEPFFTTKERGKGTGLGLSTVFGIVQQNQGSIWLYSEPGRGTSIKIYLPQSQESETARKQVQAPAMQLGSETILLVEDDDQVRAGTRRALLRGGYVVLEASGADEALALAAQHGGKVDLLLTDVVMPTMTGVELATHLLARWPGTRVLCLSGYTDEAVVEQGMIAPGYPFLQKPVTLATLTSKVREVLSAPPPAAPTVGSLD